MLGGETPFDITEDDTPEQVLKKLNGNKLKLTGGNWDHVSAEAKVSSFFSTFVCGREFGMSKFLRFFLLDITVTKK